MATERPADSLRKLGILAGGGALPGRLIDLCRESGRPFFVIALEGHAEPALVAGDVPHAWVRLGAAGRTIEILRGQGVEDLVMVGPVRRPSAFELRPDGTAARILAKAALKAVGAAPGDDRLLAAIVAALDDEGFRVVGVDTLLSDLLAPLGVYGTVRPDDEALADIARAAEVARALGGLDVGQGAVVQQGLVLAVEAIEGTDAMLDRCRDLARNGAGGVLVKVSKPGQERRADLPTIGVETVRRAHASGLRGIAVEAGAALVADRAAVAAAADDLGLFVIGIELPNGDEA